MTLPQVITPQAFSRLVGAGDLRPGDLVLCSTIGHWSGWIIERAQRRMLSDLLLQAGDICGNCPECASEVRNAARYIHAAAVVSAEYCGEMTAPRARLVTWPERLTPGLHVLVRRPQLPSGAGRCPATPPGERVPPGPPLADVAAATAATSAAAVAVFATRRMGRGPTMARRRLARAVSGFILRTGSFLRIGVRPSGGRELGGSPAPGRHFTALLIGDRFTLGIAAAALQVLRHHNLNLLQAFEYAPQ